ncbi:MAG: hypothetical protein PHU93_00815 [Candidatus Gracilibacteria bacterium]|nr:hypothetical protein [Candidatus Gracilibacteria bacterium]
MNLSKGEITTQGVHIEESHIEAKPAPVVIVRTPNTQRIAKAPVVEITSPEISDTPHILQESSSSKTIDSSESLASAPEKIVMKVLTSTTPARVLIANYKALLASPKFESKVTPITLELVDDRTEPRGRMTTEMISLVVPLATPSESFKVFAHELGHVVDIQYLKPGRFSSDDSDKYYDISWLDVSTKKPKMGLKDFVSGYAMTNKYEDFGESFNYYLFHNNDFAKRAKSSVVLQNKYNFFKKYVFPKQEFIGTGFELDPIPVYNWDTTKIPIALNKYLFYIK